MGAEMYEGADRLWEEGVTDIEMMELCLAAMGWKHLGAVGVAPPKRGEPDPKGLWCLSGGNDWWLNPEGHSVCAPCSGLPDPLHEDAQAMALVKKFPGIGSEVFQKAVLYYHAQREPLDINRAICECVAKMQAQECQRPLPQPST
jgi:hypothetical protein